MEKIHLVFKEGTSNKFWSVTQKENELTIRYGKVGTEGQIQIKTFDNEAAAVKEAEKLAESKRKKGYVDIEDKVEEITKLTPLEAARRLKDKFITELEKGYPAFLESAENTKNKQYKTPEKIAAEYMIVDVAGWVHTLRFSISTHYEGYAWLTMNYKLGWGSDKRGIEVEKIKIEPEEYKVITEKEINEELIPAIFQWVQDKIENTPYGGIIDYKVEVLVNIHINNQNCLKNVFLVDTKRQKQWREKLKPYIENREYKVYGGKVDRESDASRLAEPMLMVDELEIDDISRFFNFLKDEKENLVSCNYGIKSLYNNIRQVIETYASKENPTNEETNKFHEFISFILALSDDLIYWQTKYFKIAIRDLIKNGYQFEVPYAKEIDEVHNLIKTLATQWQKETTTTGRKLRRINIELKQLPVGKVGVTIHNTDYNADINIALFGTGSTPHWLSDFEKDDNFWTKEQLAKVKDIVFNIVKDRQDIFCPGVKLYFSISLGKSQISFNLDIEVEPEYQQYITHRLDLLNRKKFDELGYPYIADGDRGLIWRNFYHGTMALELEVKDIIDLLTQVDANIVQEYLTALENYAGKNKIKLKESSLAITMKDFFEKEAVTGDGKKNDALAILAIFTMKYYVSSYGKDKVMKFLKKLYREKNKYAMEYLSDYKDWLDGGYWFGRELESEEVAKLLKKKPKAGILYTQKTNGAEVIIAMADESKEAYEQVLDYLLKTVPKAAKSASDEELGLSVTIFFQNKPEFPDVPIYKHNEEEWPELNGNWYPIPRSSELAFFKKALEWEELHEKITQYADLLLKSEWRINQDAEFCSLAALAVVVALTMHDRKYFEYAKKYAALADEEHEEVQIHMIPGIIKKYGVNKETFDVIGSLAASFQNGYEYMELYPELEELLSEGDE